MSIIRATPGVWTLIPLIFLITFTAPTAHAQQFLERVVKEGIGIRALGMGGAFTAVADDGTSTFYNPAGLGSLGVGYETGDLDINSTISQSNRYTSLILGSAGYSAWTRSSTNESVDVTSYGFGRFGGRGISWGVSYKTIRGSLTSGGVLGFSSDFGMLVRITKDVNFGFLIQDIAEATGLVVPTGYRVGLAYRPLNKGLTFAIDWDSAVSVPGSILHSGVEVAVAQGLKLRAGYRQGRTSGGASFDFPLIRLEYAYVIDPLTARPVHLFGGKWNILRPVERPFSLIRPKEFALLSVGGNIVGGGDDASVFGGYHSGADALISQIKRAIRDPAIDGIFLQIGGIEGGLGATGIIQELRAELRRAKLAGKKVVAYLEQGAVGDEYYLASVADTIISPAGAHLGGIGKSLAIQRVRGLMDKIGVDMQVFAKGKYKDSFDPFRSKASPEQSQMIQSLITDIYQQTVSDIALDRDIPKQKVLEIADGRIFTTRQAKELKLIDEIGYEKNALKSAGKLVGESDAEPRLVPPDQFFSETPEDYLASVFNRIAVVEIDGEITTGENTQNVLFGGRTVGSDTIVREIDKALEDIYVRAILVRINSPGGSPVGSAHVYSALLKAREKGKIVIASMGDVAASGGYYIASAADQIMADPSTLTGSIGVIGNIPVLAELYNKLGIHTEVYKEGKHSDMFSGTRKFTEEEKESIYALLEESYKDFIQAIVTGRKMVTAEVEAKAEGHVYTGKQAKQEKLVDELGSFSDAVDLAARMSNIRGEPQLVFYHRSPSYLFQLGASVGEFLGLPRNFWSWPWSKAGKQELTEFRTPW